MLLNSKHRRELAARGHHLRATFSLSAEISAEQMQHVRSALAHRELLKVRIRSEDRAACERAAAELAAGVPCEIVQRVGRVVLLYRPSEPGDRQQPQPDA